MTPGFMAYIALVSVTVAFAVRAGGRLNRALVARGKRGIPGYDPQITGEYANSPLNAWRAGALTRTFRIMSTSVRDDPELERLRRSSVTWTALAVAAFFLGLVLI